MFGRIPFLKLPFNVSESKSFLITKKYAKHGVSQRAWRLRTSGLVNELERLLPNLLIFQTFTILAKGRRGIERTGCGATSLTSTHCSKFWLRVRNWSTSQNSQLPETDIWRPGRFMSFFLRWHLLLFVLGSAAVLHVCIYCGLPWLIGVQDLHRISRRVQGVSLATLNMEPDVPKLSVGWFQVTSLEEWLGLASIALLLVYIFIQAFMHFLSRKMHFSPEHHCCAAFH